MIAESIPLKVCAIVGTIARPAEVAACVRALLANTYAPYEVVVVDQSHDGAIKAELQSVMAADRRLRYMHSDVAGKTRAQNLAIASSDADVFAFTDDDCIVPPNWVECIVATFKRLPDAGLLFGEVHTPAGHDWATAFSPSMYIAHEERLHPRFLPRVNYLFGCSMAVTRQTFNRLGLFDETLGPGGKLAEANEEVEFHLRALRVHPPVGVYLTPAFHVVHEYGNRAQGPATRKLLRTYQTGKSAMLTKHALRRDVGAACQLVLLAFEPFLQGAVNLVRTGRPRGIAMIVPYMDGIVRGLRLARRSKDTPMTAGEVSRISRHDS